MPMTMPSVVRMERSLFARMASHDDAQPLQALRGKSQEARRMRVQHRRDWRWFVAGDQAVANADDAPGVPGDVLLVGDDDDGVALVARVRRTGP